MKDITHGWNCHPTALGRAAALGFGCLALMSLSARADHVNVTGQSQKMQGEGTPASGNPAEGSKPSLPGDQPAKAGTHQGSQVRNTDQHDMTGKKQGTSQ
ncbi:MAG: hypothetical protein JSR99_14410 [Proteobacteria bacterium]|nr:hypothetical protein [Pseudomonadota bacterium]